jgi:hypothetical protein
VRRILDLQEENRRLRGQVDRLRRLLGEAEVRHSGRPMSDEAMVHTVRVRTRRNLPDVRRGGLFE